MSKEEVDRTETATAAEHAEGAAFPRGGVDEPDHSPEAAKEAAEIASGQVARPRLGSRPDFSRGSFLKRAGGVLAGLAVLGLSTEKARADTSSFPAPSGLTALARDSTVVLAWQPVAGASGYNVYRGPSTGQPTTLLVSGIESTSFSDASASNGTGYVYSVHALGAVGESGDSNLVLATPLGRAVGNGNAIVLENSYPGSTAWKLQGGGQPPTGLEGFATAISIDAGESVDLKVNTQDDAPYRIEIYRVGYYGGAQARLISTLTGLSGVEQPYPQKDYSTGLIDCSNWSVSATLSTTPDWPTGIYLLRLVREDNGYDNHMLLVIRHDGVSADIGYALAVTTYQSYNNWGGKSLYTYNSSGDVTDSGTARAVKVSYDRPFNQSLSGERNWFTNCDIQNVSWIEQQGYDLAYLTSIDVHEGAPLSGYKTYLSSTHDEYWSQEMRDALTQARDAGVSIVFLGANAVYWKIRFEQYLHNPIPNRIQVCYKTVESGGPDPSGIPTTTWRDPAVGQPENALIGQMYVGDNDNVFFPLVVSSDQAENRVWRYTSLTTLAPGTSARIGRNLLGWEWDARVANGLEPAGVITLAASAASGELLTDAGCVYANGSTTTNATIYTAPSGAHVFDTGSMHWSRGLALNMGGVGEPNPTIQQATVNVLQDMGVRATTPAAGIVLDQLGAPSLLQTVPTAGASGVGVVQAITAVFDRALDPETVNAESFTLTGPNGPVTAGVSYSDASHTASLTPEPPLAVSSSYTATLTSAIEAIDGSPLASPASWGFTTIAGPFSLFPANPTPALVNLPTQDGRGGSGPWSYELGVKVQVVSPLELIAIRFYKDASETGTHVGTLWSSSGTILAQTTFSGESASGWQQQALASSFTLEPGQIYVVSVGLNAYFVETQSALQAQITNGPLQSVADGKNGVFGASKGTFPTGSYRSTSYFVDLVAQ